MMFNWDNLTKDERAEYMMLQMSPHYGGRSNYLPDDCSECGACGYPVLGAGWCKNCRDRHKFLQNKLLYGKGVKVQ